MVALLNMAVEFEEVFGMRFVGLFDEGNLLRATYEYPFAEAPYPRDIVIDQNGIIRYWATEYDPQRLIEVIGSLLGVTTNADEITQQHEPIRLESARPNPFHTGIQIDWTAPRGAWRLKLHDAGGRVVRNLGIFQGPGRRTIRWNGRNDSGRRVPSGSYFIRLSDGEHVSSRRILRLR